MKKIIYSVVALFLLGLSFTINSEQISSSDLNLNNVVSAAQAQSESGGGCLCSQTQPTTCWVWNDGFFIAGVIVDCA